MRIAINVAGVILLLLGLVWVLQGANIMGGSVMSGDSKWSVIGVIVMLVGLGVVWWANRRK